MICEAGEKTRKFLADESIGSEWWKASNRQGIALDMTIGTDTFPFIERAMNAGLEVEVWSIDTKTNYIELHLKDEL